MNGTQDLIALADEAVAVGHPEKIVNRLRTGLCELINSGECDLPAQRARVPTRITTRAACCIG